MRLVSVLVVALVACQESANAPVPPPCDDKCKDEIAVRAIRETMKLGFNLTLQGKPVGQHDIATPCPQGGRARLFGMVTSNAEQGATNVDLTYELAECQYLETDDEPKENYRMTVTGTLRQKGVLAVQPTSTNAILIDSDSVTIKGTVNDPPLPYEVTACPLKLGQNGNKLSGTLCDRVVSVDL
jgi:hypothetical protein